MRVWEKEDVFFSADEYFAEIKKDIAHAQKSVSVETYIFNPDQVGVDFIDELNTAARRGVEVRLLVDGVGTTLSATDYIQDHLEKKVQFRVYHPVPWSLTVGSLQKKTGVRAFLRFLFGINKRNHRKICVIDDQMAYVGSMNIWKKDWRDTGVRVEGREAAALTTAFDNAWLRADFKNLESFSGVREKRYRSLVRLNDRWSLRRQLFLDLLSRIERAERRIWITNAYFVPNGRLVKAIADAGKRGVDVRILVPRYCDVFFIPLVRAVFYGGLLQAYVKIFEYLPTMLHSKTMIIDDWGIVGSSNMNHRSLHHDLEADIVLTHKDTLATLAHQFRMDLNHSAEVTLEEFGHRPWLKTSSGQALFLLKNWM